MIYNLFFSKIYQVEILGINYPTKNPIVNFEIGFYNNVPKGKWNTLLKSHVKQTIFDLPVDLLKIHKHFLLFFFPCSPLPTIPLLLPLSLIFLFLFSQWPSLHFNVYAFVCVYIYIFIIIFICVVVLMPLSVIFLFFLFLFYKSSNIFPFSKN